MLVRGYGWCMKNGATKTNTTVTESCGYEIYYRGKWVMDGGVRGADAIEQARKLSLHHEHRGLVEVRRLWATTVPGLPAVFTARFFVAFIQGRQVLGPRPVLGPAAPAAPGRPLDAVIFRAEVRCA